MIFYFSATGNSLYAAKKISNELNTDLISVSEAAAQSNFHFKIEDDESVGFVIPTYFYGIPTIVTDFISHLVLEGKRDPYIYLVLTCGTTTGNACKMFEKQLNSVGYKLSSTYAVSMINNYVLMFSIPEINKQKEMLDKADIQINDIIQKIKLKEQGDFNNKKGFTPSLMTAISYPIYKQGRKTKKFYAKENCTNCGLCQKVCPCNAISISSERPKWQKERCIHCLGCINRCPVKAIEYGRATIKRGRYVNPNVSL